jgi:polyhydroxybutyrate depolymerase
MKTPHPVTHGLTAVVLPMLTLLLALLATLLVAAAASGASDLTDPVIDHDNPPSELRISREQGQPVVSWAGSGVLHSASNPQGRWRAVAHQSPYPVNPTASAAYYRISAQYDRPAVVRPPAGYDSSTPTPLIVSLHGYSVDISTLEVRLPFEPLADSYNFIYVQPQGTLDSTGRRFWNGTDACCAYDNSSVNDSAYLRALIDAIRRNYAVDPKRIYITGYSNGGFMAHRMACDHADLIAAVVSYAGATFLDPGACVPTEPVSILQIHGTEDPVILYGGGTYDLRGGPYPGAQATVQSWGDLVGCISFADLPNSSFDLVSDIAGNETSISTFAECPSARAVELWTIQGGAHWETLDAQRIVEWLLAHPKPD